MKLQNLICIGCPLGCPLQVTIDGATVIKVEGHTCPRGDIYARKEVVNPTRIVTSTVCVKGSQNNICTVPVKTSADIPKSKIFDCMKDIKDLTVCAPVHIGDTIKTNVAQTGVDIVATRDVL
ncbi:MAG: DUF1667 domain-containing protein [Candidatus Fimivivens sp.]